MYTKMIRFSEGRWFTRYLLRIPGTGTVTHTQCVSHSPSKHAHNVSINQGQIRPSRTTAIKDPSTSRNPNMAKYDSYGEAG